FNALSSNGYYNQMQQVIVTSWGGYATRGVYASLSISSWSASALNFSSDNGIWSSGWQLAWQIPTDMPIWQMVDYVNVPPQITPLDTVHVVADRFNGTPEGFQADAVIDFDGDGVRDSGENWLADFGAGGNADLANSVVIHFNDIPGTALNLTGFGTDDKIEIEMEDSWINDFAVGLNSVNYQLARFSGGAPTPITGNTITVIQARGTFADFNSNNYTNAYRITYTGTTHTPSNAVVPVYGAIAYWTDATNALNNQANLLPDYFDATPLSHTAVLANLNTNHYPGLVEFVWPVNVVVEEEGAFIDANANGVLDEWETTDGAVFAAGGNADLGANNVAIHFNDIPNMPIDLSGFNGNDRIEIDLSAMKFGDDSMIRSNQGTAWHGWTEFYEGVSGVRVSGSGYSAAAYVEGNALKTGHLTWTSSRTVGGSTNWYQKFTATAPFEGTLAVNVGPLYNHYQQVAYVIGGGGPM
ncbi:MAG: hypothetical protein WA003_06935, partial [Desulfuromonadaceae bacterium]